MQYFVVDPSGQKFGPADISVLIKWVGENRIFPTTVLEELMTGKQIMANQLAGLGLPPPGDFYQGVQASPHDYPRVTESPGDKQSDWAIALGISGFFMCPLLCLVGVGVAAYAHSLKSTKAKIAMQVCIGALALQIVIFVLVFVIAGYSLRSLIR